MTFPSLERVRHRNTRRTFLRLSGSAVLALMAHSCAGKTEPSLLPTRTPRPAFTATPAIPTMPPMLATVAPLARSPLPTPTSGVTPDLATAVSAAPSVTAGPSATPAATATPTATPTPTASPFPPGPPTKLGLFITRNEPRMRGLLGTGNVALLKTMELDPNFAQELKARAPHALLIGRIDLPQVNLDSMDDPHKAAREFVDRLLPIATEPRRRSTFDGWESFNEPVVNGAENMSRLAEFEAVRTELLAEAGIRSVIGNFATGTPDLALWPHFRPALEAALRHKGWLGLHEYSAPTMQFGTAQDPTGLGVDAEQDGWLTLRYRKVYQEYLIPNKLVVPLLLTEVGVDGHVTNRPGPQGKGWEDFGDYWDQIGLGKDAPGNYVEQLAWYDAHLQQDEYVQGAAIFAAGASPGWESFEILNQVEEFLEQYLSVHPPR